MQKSPGAQGLNDINDNTWSLFKALPHQLRINSGQNKQAMYQPTQVVPPVEPNLEMT